MSLLEFLKKVALAKEKAVATEGVGQSTQLHLDEISFKKGYRQFETVVYTDTQVLTTMTGRKSDDLQAILRKIPGVDRIKTVCMDMCAAFRDAVRQALPQAEIVCDRFHILKLLHKKLDKLRINQYNRLHEAKQGRFKSVRFLLFKDRRELLRPEKRLEEVVNACLFPISNGRAEGINNKIKLIKRLGYGFRNRLNCRLHVLAACNP